MLPLVADEYGAHQGVMQEKERVMGGP